MDKMIEQQLESILIDHIRSALKFIDGLKVVGAWQTKGADGNKA